MPHPCFILASESPRRRDMLAALDLSFRCEPPRVEEILRPDEPPAEFARRMAALKASTVARQTRDRLPVLAADTIVCIDDHILGKPSCPETAISTLRRLSGRTHAVLTAVALHVQGTTHERFVMTDVTFRKLSNAQIEWYVNTGEAADKAGSYAIQGKGAFMVDLIDGSPSNVIGLPLGETIELLESAAVKLPWNPK